MKNRLNVRKVALLAGAVLFPIGALAMPLDMAMTKTETVKYSAPDAATADGAAVLYRKLQETAARVCGEAEIATTSTYIEDSYGSCVADALGKAVRQVGIPMVSALHMQGVASGKLTSSSKASVASETIASR